MVSTMLVMARTSQGGERIKEKTDWAKRVQEFLEG